MTKYIPLLSPSSEGGPKLLNEVKKIIENKK